MCIYTVRIRYSYSPPWKFRQKRCFKCKASRAIFWPLPTYKELKLTTKPFTGCTLGGLLNQCKILASKVRVCAESKISTVFTSSFCFLSSPELLLLFLPLFCLLLGILVTGKVLGKTLRILGLDERKGRTWVVE